ncbi:MAG TPA: DNA-protecting protein DprA [Deltaproteobacteria bacterium]|nr:DNA-protecting protein DprA [Deltaproteobacteria bacterium]
MDTISSFWSGAQQLADQLDLDDLARRAGGWRALVRAEVRDLVELGLSPEVARRWLSTPPQTTRGSALTRLHPSYPAHLAQRRGAPPVLFVDGELELLQRRAIAVVGTRRCTPYGASVARHLGAALGRAGLVTISGLARGIDTHAHRGALCTGQTLAVLGHGLAHTSPPSNAELRGAIEASGGASVTTFPDHRTPARWTFPSRNRWIVGLAECVVIVEAPRGSGALITARLAAEHDVPVYVIPGQIGVSACRGSNELIEAGALPLLDVEAFVAHQAGLPPEHERPDWLVHLLAGGTLEESARLRGISLLDLLEDLTRLELIGQVVRLPGGRYAPGGGPKSTGNTPPPPPSPCPGELPDGSSSSRTLGTSTPQEPIS